LPPPPPQQREGLCPLHLRTMLASPKFSNLAGPLDLSTVLAALILNFFNSNYEVDLLISLPSTTFGR
jgi:hypothetical protein